MYKADFHFCGTIEHRSLLCCLKIGFIWLQMRISQKLSNSEPTCKQRKQDNGYNPDIPSGFGGAMVHEFFLVDQYKYRDGYCRQDTGLKSLGKDHEGRRAFL